MLPFVSETQINHRTVLAIVLQSWANAIGSDIGILPVSNTQDYDGLKQSEIRFNCQRLHSAYLRKLL